MTKRNFICIALSMRENNILSDSEASIFRYANLLSKKQIESAGLKSFAARSDDLCARRILKLGRRRKSRTYFDLNSVEIQVVIKDTRRIVASALGCESWEDDGELRKKIDGVGDAIETMRALECLDKVVAKADYQVPDDQLPSIQEKIIQYEKTRYLIRSFRHTHGKDYENYVITGIWHRLRKLGLEHDLQPVTQQYIKLNDGYALLDLYFPAVQLAVECDEAYHLTNFVRDEHRENDIQVSFAKCSFDEKHRTDQVGDLDALSAAGVNAHQLEILRVDASLPYGEIDAQLDKIVKRTQEKFIEMGSPIWDIRAAEEIVKEDGELNVDRGLVFDSVPAVLDGLGIRRQNSDDKISGWWSGGYPRKNTDLVILWFPHLALVKGKWENIISDEGNVITENRGDEFGESASECWKRDADALDKKERSMRVVFAHSRNALGENGYRFMGVFKLRSYGVRDENGAPANTVWEKVSDKLEIRSSWPEFVRYIKSL